jgi:hypothetical protein
MEPMDNRPLHSPARIHYSGLRSLAAYLFEPAAAGLSEPAAVGGLMLYLMIHPAGFFNRCRLHLMMKNIFGVLVEMGFVTLNPPVPVKGLVWIGVQRPTGGVRLVVEYTT